MATKGADVCWSSLFFKKNQGLQMLFDVFFVLLACLFFGWIELSERGDSVEE